MAKFYGQNLSDVQGPQKPQLGPYAGLKLAKDSRARAPLGAQDKAPALGRRIICSQSLRGDSTWLVPDTDPVSATQDYPRPDGVRPVGRARCNITPGHFLQLSIVMVPSGETQTNEGPGDEQSGGIGGEVQVAVTWTDQGAGTETTTETQTLTVSGELFGAAPAAPWSTIAVRNITIVHPAGVTFDHSVRNKWTQHVSAEIELRNIGGARIIDAVVVERPWSIAREADDAGHGAAQRKSPPFPPRPQR